MIELHQEGRCSREGTSELKLDLRWWECRVDTNNSSSRRMLFTHTEVKPKEILLKAVLP